MKKLLCVLPLLIAANGFGQTYFSDNFNTGNLSAWKLYDRDGDGHNWEPVALPDLSPAIASYSYDNATNQALTPDNFIVSPAIDLTSAVAPILKYKVKGQDPSYAAEKYAVYVSNSNTVDGILAQPAVLTELVTDNGAGGVFHAKTIDLSAYKGQSQVYVAFRHFDVSDQFAIHLDDVSVEEVPTSAPNCATPNTPANGAADVPYMSLTLTWTASTTGPAADSYDIYLGTDANPTTLKGTATGTGLTVTGLTPSTKYYWKVVPKNSVGAAGGCTVSSFTTMAPTYCEAGATSTQFEKISNVTFANINNNSTSTAGYEDFTSVVGDVTAGNTYAFSANAAQSFSSDQLIVWIDFNQDKTFSDDEKVFVSAKGKAPWTGNIAIPANAMTGQTRMRVRLHDSSLSPNATPCGNSNYGQVEDYTLNISPVMGVSEAARSSARFFPNPVKDVFNIEMQSKISSVKVYDVAGKLLSTQKADGEKLQMDMSKLAPGVYVVTTTTADGKSVTTKVVKQ